jgi:FkbM family methyltransferase
MINYQYVDNNIISVSDNSVVYNGYTWSKPQIYQLDAIEFFYNLIKDGYCVLDVGAQSGVFSLMAKYLPTVNFHSFEPDPINFQCLLENLEINEIENVKPYDIALSSEVGYAEFNICTTHRGLNTLGKNVLNFKNYETEKISIDTSTIDEVFANQKIDLIKIDTEGCECDILLGGFNTIKKYKPKIFLEYYDRNLNQFNKTIYDLDRLIEQLDYNITWRKNDNILIESRI